ncbi:MAG: hypothetical protein E6I81_09810 [Chloroflexi bacterium]|nr:MAG: hypothetical protein E6I89_05645 [Chloroflexota bacterium]TMD71701.1 MAG: hypothetical protein E6I81_09810 [Chloroflexota bacterium]
MLAWIREHIGEWISIRAQVERAPARFTLTVTLGELPEGWTRSANHARTWAGIAGLLLITPFIALLVATLLHGMGQGAAYEWISNSSVAIIAATISLFIGIPVAIGMNLWRITLVGLRRHARALEGLVALEVAPLHLVVVALAVLIGGLFVAHLAADSYACWNGVRSAC